MIYALFRCRFCLAEWTAKTKTDCERIAANFLRRSQKCRRCERQGECVEVKKGE